jgi:hypothetical protein
MKYILILALCFLFIACTDERGAKRVLLDNGYTNVQITGFDFFTCSDKETFATGFTATSPNGRRVQGAVCSGVMKGYTIRFK